MPNRGGELISGELVESIYNLPLLRLPSIPSPIAEDREGLDVGRKRVKVFEPNRRS
jgi:hypothetical protein